MASSVEAAQIAASLGSVAAAAAAWRAVATTRQAGMESLEPNLTAVISNSEPGADEPPESPVLVGVEIRNVGGGTAKRPGVWLVALGRTLRADFMGDGFISAGDSMELVSPIVGPAADGEAAALVWCRDHREMLHAWSHRGEHRRYKPRWRRQPWTVRKDIEELWTEFFPNIPADPSSPLDARARARTYGGTFRPPDQPFD